MRLGSAIVVTASPVDGSWMCSAVSTNAGSMASSPITETTEPAETVPVATDDSRPDASTATSSPPVTTAATTAPATAGTTTMPVSTATTTITTTITTTTVPVTSSSVVPAMPTTTSNDLERAVRRRRARP